MPKIFVSYRRVDSQAVTDRLHDHMVMHFDNKSVFQDVDSIPLGADFPEYLSAEVDECDVVLVVIGTEWVRILNERADQPDDFVRIEVESALHLKKLVIPVLVNGATMPNPNDLPPSVRDLCRKNAAKVRPNPDFRHDCQRLADSIQHTMAMIAIPTTSQQPTSLSLMPAPFDWIEIPGGQGAAERYRIAKYPITNTQFAKFIEAGGYQQQKWWTAEGWQKCQEGWYYDNSWKPSGKPWTQPYYWTEIDWNGEEHPVIGVSWYEAISFCLWLSDVTNEKIMLPTVAQWQYAAQGDDRRCYPWGNYWDSGLCNNSVDGKRIGGSTPVKHYEGKGDSQFGVVDMVGNAMEWCLTGYDTNTNDINSNANFRSICGGAWTLKDINRFCCDFCAKLHPIFRYGSMGFRLACE